MPRAHYFQARAAGSRLSSRRAPTFPPFGKRSRTFRWRTRGSSRWRKARNKAGSSSGPFRNDRRWRNRERARSLANSDSNLTGGEPRYRRWLLPECCGQSKLGGQSDTRFANGEWLSFKAFREENFQAPKSTILGLNPYGCSGLTLSVIVNNELTYQFRSKPFSEFNFTRICPYQIDRHLQK